MAPVTVAPVYSTASAVVTALSTPTATVSTEASLVVTLGAEAPSTLVSASLTVATPTYLLTQGTGAPLGTVGTVATIKQPYTLKQ